MEKKSYAERLKDPRWQKKRLEIFERDGWQCQRCSHTEYPLAVHHLRYIHGLNPWEYDEKLLLTLCEYCHEAEYKEMPEAMAEFTAVLSDHRYFASDLRELSSILSRMDFDSRWLIFQVPPLFLVDGEFKAKITALVETELKKQSDEFMTKLRKETEDDG